MNYWRGRRALQEVAPDRDGMGALRRALGHQWEFKPALWGQFSAEQRELLRLTREQYVILGVLNRQRQVAISGFAGSGKTLLAAEKATRLARQGFRVLLTCFNLNLAQDLGEPGNTHVSIGYRGLYRFRLQIRGGATHTGRRAWEQKSRGRNAILEMARVALALAAMSLLVVPAAETHPQAEIVQTLAGAAERITGVRPPVAGSGPACDGWMFTSRGIPTVCGYGVSCGGVHGADEWADLASLRTLTEVYAQTILSYLGV